MASLRLEITSDERGSWLHLTYPPVRCGPAPVPGPAGGELTLIDSMAQRWGHYGDGHWHTLWALVAPSDSAADRPKTPAGEVTRGDGLGVIPASRDASQAVVDAVREPGRRVGAGTADAAAARPAEGTGPRR